MFKFFQNFKNNPLKSIENVRLKSLTELNISNNELKEKMNELLSECTSLEELNLQNTKMIEIPKEYKNLTNLKKLKLDYGKISTIETLCLLVNLNSLSVNNNNLSTINQEIINLQNLTSLSLSFNTLVQIPEHLEKLINLKILNLSHNKIKQVSSIVSFTNLNSLDLSFNRIKVIPLTIITLTNLSTLMLSGNTKKGFPMVDSLNKNTVNIFFRQMIGESNFI